MYRTLLSIRQRLKVKPLYFMINIRSNDYHGGRWSSERGVTSCSLTAENAANDACHEQMKFQTIYELVNSNDERQFRRIPKSGVDGMGEFNAAAALKQDHQSQYERLEN